MFKKARYFRWAILFITIVVEIAAFWFGGPQTDQTLKVTDAIIKKLNHPLSWTWVGWASLSMAWIWAEFAFVFFSNGRRARALIRRSQHEKLIFDTGVHWFVLLRDIYLNQLNDGEKEKLEANLFPKAERRSIAWHAVWWPILFALLTCTYFLGLVAWSLRQMPGTVETWSASSQVWIEERFRGPSAVVGKALMQITQCSLHWLQALNDIARSQPLITLVTIFGVWFIFRLAARFAHTIPVLPFILNSISRLSILMGVFALFSTKLFDWLFPLYNLTPHHGLVAMGFFPLTLASAFYFPHILFWSSWRYAIIRDTETHDATLMRLGGVFNSLQQRINLQRIVDTDIFQLWWQRIFNIGDIELKEMGGGKPERVRHVYGPHSLLEEIRNAIREGKKRSGQRSEFEDERLEQF